LLSNGGKTDLNAAILAQLYDTQTQLRFGITDPALAWNKCGL